MTITNDTTKTAKQLAQDVARKIANEPLEILKTVSEQITGREGNFSTEEQIEVKTPPSESSNEEDLKKNLERQGQRQLQALEAEIADIRQQKASQEKRGQEIQGKEEINKQEEIQKQKVLKEPSAKPNRKFAGEGLGAKRQQQRVEKPLPPSG